jgi:hypothetical protein
MRRDGSILSGTRPGAGSYCPCWPATDITRAYILSADAAANGYRPEICLTNSNDKNELPRYVRRPTTTHAGEWLLQCGTGAVRRVQFRLRQFATGMRSNKSSLHIRHVAVTLTCNGAPLQGTGPRSLSQPTNRLGVFNCFSRLNADRSPIFERPARVGPQPSRSRACIGNR